MLLSPKCPVCGHVELESKPYIVPGRVVSDVAQEFFGSREKKRCPSCETGFAYPYFEAVELDRYYAKTYWQERLGPAEPSKLDFKRAQEHYMHLFEALDQSESILDFGCGRGEFPLYLRRLYPDKKIQATDKSLISKPYLQEQGVLFHDRLETCAPVDLLYASHSLEHVSDLNESIDQFLAMTSDSAFLFFEVPNIGSRYVFETCAHIPHTYMFSVTSFEELSKRYALDLLSADICGITWAQKLGTQDAEAMNQQVHLRVLLRKR